jgi:hypothetical protein
VYDLEILKKEEAKTRVGSQRNSKKRIAVNYDNEISIVAKRLSGRAQSSEATYAKSQIRKHKYFQNNTQNHKYVNTNIFRITQLFPHRSGLRISESMLY